MTSYLSIFLLPLLHFHGCFFSSTPQFINIMPINLKLKLPCGGRWSLLPCLGMCHAHHTYTKCGVCKWGHLTWGSPRRICSKVSGEAIRLAASCVYGRDQLPGELWACRVTPKPSLFMQQLHLGLTSCVQDQITVSWLSYAHAIPKFVCRVFKERKRHLLLKGGLVCINQTPFSNLLHQMHQHPHQAPTCQKTIWLEFCLDWWHYHISFFQ